MPKLTQKKAADYIAALPGEWRGFSLRSTKGHQVQLFNAFGRKVMGTGGGGYSKSGVCMARFIEAACPDLLVLAAKLRGANYGTGCTNKNGLYGLTIYRGPKGATKQVKRWQAGDRVALQGMCGFNSMAGVLEAVGLAVCEVASGPDYTAYALRPASGLTYDTLRAARLRGEALRARLGYKQPTEA